MNLFIIFQYTHYPDHSEKCCIFQFCYTDLPHLIYMLQSQKARNNAEKCNAGITEYTFLNGIMKPQHGILHQ